MSCRTPGKRVVSMNMEMNSKTTTQLPGARKSFFHKSPLEQLVGTKRS